MRLLTRLRGAIALMISFFMLGCLVAAPLAAHADKGKKGGGVPIKVGDPIIVKDPPKKK